MVQILPSRGFGAGFTEAFPEAFKESAAKYRDVFEQREERKNEDEALKRLGYDVSGIKDPRIRESLLSQSIANKRADIDALANQETTNAITKYFGEEAGELYPHLTEGGKTKFTELMLNGRLYGKDLAQTLSEFIQESPQEAQEMFAPLVEGQQPQQQMDQSSASQMSPSQTRNELPKTSPQVPSQTKITPQEESFPQISFPQMPPKELTNYKLGLRKENVDIFQKANTELRSLKKIDTDLNQLQKLDETGKLPEGMGKLILDKEGNIRPWAQILELASPQAERFVKIVNDFTTKAKDSYGARVTNFELDRFMKRLPTLLNSKEGRQGIIQQMRLTNQLDQLYNDALKKVYKHYGLEGIPQEKANEIAENMIQDQEKELLAQYDQIDKRSSEIVAKSKTPKGRVTIEINGKIGHVPQDQVEMIVQRGGRVL